MSNESKDLSVNHKEQQQQQQPQQMQCNQPNSAGLNSEMERQQLISYINEAEERLQYRAEERKANLKENIKYPNDAFFAKLDSSIKKNSAFVKKLRNLTESQRDSILKELTSINLKKYISEVASSIVDAKIKMSDVNLALKVCSQLHRMYPDFSPQLLELWTKQLPKKPSDLTSVNASKLRTDLRMIAELVIIGVFNLKEGLPILGQLLTLITKYDRENHVHLSTLLSFCKNCGDEFLGLIPRRIINLSEKFPDLQVPRSNFLTPENQRSVNNLFREYYKSLVLHVTRDHETLKKLDFANQKALLSRGEVTNERKEQFETASAAFSKLQASAQQFADFMNENFPELGPIDAHLELTDAPLDFEVPSGSVTIDTSNRFKTSVEMDANSIWEDEDTRSFYTNFPDLKSLVPSILYKESAKDGLKVEDASSEESKVKEVTDGELDEILHLTEVQNPAELLFIDEPDEQESPLTGSKEDLVVATSSSSSNKLTPNTASNTSRASNKAMMDAFVTSLNQCVNRDMIDKAATNFVTNLNTKKNRNKLVRTLFSVPRIRLDLLPFYARLVKTLYPLMPHVANDLIELLKQDFMYHVKKKDQINIESKIKTVRFIGELVKFDLYTKSDAIYCLRLLLHDFAHHSIEMAAALLETCGRYLLRSPATHHQMASLLDLMMRKKALLSFDSRYISIIENAYYAANPVVETVTSQSKKNRPPHHLYARHLLYVVLDKKNVEYVLKQIRKFDWNDPETADYLIKCLISVWNINFLNIRYAASLLSLLKDSQEDAVYRVIDGTLEEIQVMLEINRPLFNQRRISVMKFLGELYNYKLIDSSVIFRELYTLITFGTDYSQYFAPYKSSSHGDNDLDPPEHLFRIRLVCQLLDTCAVYFASSLTKKKLDYFLLFFQKYYWLKKSHPVFNNSNNPQQQQSNNQDEFNLKSNLLQQQAPSALTGSSGFPITIDILFIDTVKKLRPKFKFASNLNEANEAVENIVHELKPKLMELYPDLTSQPNENVKVCNNVNNNRNAFDANSGLNVIPEEQNSDDSTSDQEGNVRDEGDVDEDDDDEGGQKSQDRQDEPVDEGNSDDEGDFDDEDLCSDDGSSDLSTASGDRTTPTATLPGPKYVSCPEDDEFLKEFDRMMAESINSRSTYTRSTVADITIPVEQVVHSRFTDGLSEAKKGNFQPSSCVSDSNGHEFGEPNSVNILVMTRVQAAKGNQKGSSKTAPKAVLKPIKVPLDSEFALVLKEKEEKERLEKQRLKQLTLNIAERMDEAELSHGNTSGATGQFNRTLHNREGKK